MKASKSDISLELECWVDELSPAQLAAYERVANEHNAIKNTLKSALSAHDGKELFNGQVFQAYSFKGKVLQELKEATIPKKPLKSEQHLERSAGRAGRKRSQNFLYLQSTDEEDDDVPLAKRIAAAGLKTKSLERTRKGLSDSPSSINSAVNKVNKSTKETKPSKVVKMEASSTTTAQPMRPSEDTAIGGLLIGTESFDGKNTKENKESKLQGKTFPSLVVVAKPWLKVKDMSATRNKLDSKVKLVLILTPNKFAEWLIQEGLLKAEQRCCTHKNSEMKLGVYSDASKFPYTGGYVWISECCPSRFVSVFNGSIFEGAPHPPSCILKLIYHWACQTNIQNVVQWVKVDNVYVKGVYTWLRAVCTLAVHQKCRKLGGLDKYVEVGVISFGTTSQDGKRRQLKVEVLGVLDYAEKTIRLRAVQPLIDPNRYYKKRFQVILEPLQHWVHKDSIICIDLTVDKMTLFSMGFNKVIQASVADSNAKRTNASVMDYLRRIVPRMFQNTLSLLSPQMIQQFLDELVWREQFGTYALQAFNNITAHIAEQTRLHTSETLTQRLYHVATNPFKDWSVLPANAKETPPNTTPKRLKKPINEADYIHIDKIGIKQVTKKTDEDLSNNCISASSKKRYEDEKKLVTTGKSITPATTISITKHSKSSTAILTETVTAVSSSTAAATVAVATAFTHPHKKSGNETKLNKKDREKDEDELKGLEEMYYGVQNGSAVYYEQLPYSLPDKLKCETIEVISNDKGYSTEKIECPICDTAERFTRSVDLQLHLLSHICVDIKENCKQCLFCLAKYPSELQLNKHLVAMHSNETKNSNSPSYRCLICQQKFNSLNFLTSHLQNKHNMLELPYCCKACAYRTSSHRDIVNHFYEDHKHHNFLQCLYCLDIFHFIFKNQINRKNIENYYFHLKQHLSNKDMQAKCSKCVLTFINKGALKQHAAHHHKSLIKHSQNIRKLLPNSMLIQPPKVRNHHREPLPYTVQMKFGEYLALVAYSICAECNSEIIHEGHFIGILKCNKCNYKTCCERSMLQHCVDCSGSNAQHDIMELPLPNEMHCICGFSTANGNKMARHLITCGQKSAYNCMEVAQENTVKRNMLDMLGLIKRDGESVLTIEPENLNDTNLAVTSATSIPISSITTSTTIVQQSTISANILPLATTDNNDINMMLQVEQLPLQSHLTLTTPSQLLEKSSVNQEISQISNDLTPSVTNSTSHYYTTTIMVGEGNSNISSSDVEQYHVSIHQPEETTHALNTADDIDMPLIGELADPNPPSTSQFLGEVHTPMFDAVAAAEQQHYHQMMQQQHQLSIHVPKQQHHQQQTE